VKKIGVGLCFAIMFVAQSMVLAQGPTWTKSTIQTYNGYDYELWMQNNVGTVTMKLTGDNGSGAGAKGGTFEGTWQGTQNVLFRSGRKFTNNQGQSNGSPGKSAAEYGNISIDFAATWNSNDDVKMLGVYGWAFFKQGSAPANFSNQIEYYIIQDRGSYNSATQGTNSKSYGSATIDGIEYDLRVCDRLNQPMLTGDGNFKQYFSVPKNTGSHRTSGIISVSKHFEAWEKAGMKMDGPLYEVAMKVESYSGSGSSKGSATVTKNLLTIGGTSAPSSSSAPAASSSSSMAAASPTCNDYQASFCGGIAWASVLGGSTAVPTEGKCLYIGDFDIIQPALNSTVAINGIENTCGADWDNCAYNEKPATKKDGGYYVYVKKGTINTYEDNGWQGIVAKPKPTCSAPPPASSSSAGTTPVLQNRIPVTYFSIQPQSDRVLRIEISSPAVVEIFDLKGNVVERFNVSGNLQSVKLSSPRGVYFAKVRGMDSVKFVLK